MLKRFLNFFNRIFSKKMPALPESSICFENDLESATFVAQNSSQFLKHNDELILTINNKKSGSNVNVEVLRDGKILEVNNNDEKIEEIQNDVKVEEVIKEKDTPLILEVEEMHEEITDVVDCEYYAKEEYKEEKNDSINDESLAEINSTKEVTENIEEIKLNTEQCEEVEEDTINTENIINYLKAFEFDDYEIDEIIMKNREVLYTDSEIILDNLNYLTSIGIRNREIYEMVKKQPLILIDEAVKDIKEKTEIFKKRGIDTYEAYDLYINNPDILLLETKQIEQSCKIIKKFYKTKDRLQYIIKYFPSAIGMTNLLDIRKCVEKM